MPFNTHLLPFGSDLPVRVDDEGRTHHPHILTAVVLLKRAAFTVYGPDEPTL
jgi:hypothetical protein